MFVGFVEKYMAQNMRFYVTRMVHPREHSLRLNCWRPVEQIAFRSHTIIYQYKI